MPFGDSFNFDDDESREESEKKAAMSGETTRKEHSV